MKKITRIKILGREIKEKDPLKGYTEVKVFAVTKWTGTHGWHMASFRDLNHLFSSKFLFYNTY